MKIVVLLKCPLADPAAADTLPGIGPADRAALATALTLAAEDDLVSAITAGPRAEEQVLEAALRAGVGRAMRVVDPVVTRSDQRTVATVLAGALRKIGFDLVLAGQRSPNWGTGGVGPAVAHLLRVPHVTSVVHARREGDDLILTHRRERVDLELLVQTPALVAVADGPPLPSVQSGGPHPAVELLSLSEMTLPFRRPLVSVEQQLVPSASSVEMLGDVDELINLLKRWR